MKKALSLILALALVLAAAGCGKKNDGGSGTGETIPDSLTILNKVWESYTEDEKFPAAGGDYDHSVDGAPGTFDISDADNLNYLLTLPVDDAALVDDAASLMHMMNANTFTCGAFRAADAENVTKIADDLREAIQAKQWMCGFPDKLIIFTLDNYVISLYGDEELVNTFRDKLQSVYSAASVAYDEAIEG